MSIPNKIQARENFILQQGLESPAPERCGAQFRALLFQPWLVGLAVLAGIAFQSAPLFFVLAGVLWWNAAFPRWNPFDALYRILRRPSNETRTLLPPAPPPRRFAQALAGSFAFGIALSLTLQWSAAALTLEALLFLGVSALVFGKFCFGSFVYYLIRGNKEFAKRTLPWGAGSNRQPCS